MKTKNTIIFSIISTFFLIFLILIWKILATLQGLSINSFNIEILFAFGFLISLAHKLFMFPFINPANEEENTIEVVTYPK